MVYRRKKNAALNSIQSVPAISGTRLSIDHACLCVCVRVRSRYTRIYIQCMCICKYLVYMYS